MLVARILSGIARADALQRPSQTTQTAKMSHPVNQATLRRVNEQHVFGMAIAKPQPVCADITCDGYALIGIGF